MCQVIAMLSDIVLLPKKQKISAVLEKIALSDNEICNIEELTKGQRRNST